MIARLCSVVCDDCGETESTPSADAATARWLAEQRGWTVRPESGAKPTDRDVCPTCRTEGPKNPTAAYIELRGGWRVRLVRNDGKPDAEGVLAGVGGVVPQVCLQPKPQGRARYVPLSAVAELVRL